MVLARVGSFLVAFALLLGTSAARADEPGRARQAQAPVNHLDGAQPLASGPPVFRCKTESAFDHYACVGTQPSPFDASAFDFGIGGYTSFDNVVQQYIFRFTAPNNGAVYNFKYTKQSSTNEFCPDGYLSLEGLTKYCFYGGVYQLVKVWRRVGQWKLELLEDNVVVWTALSNVKAGTIAKISGDGASGPVNEPLRIKPVFSIQHFDGSPVDISESRSSTSTDIVNFTISGPSKSTGASASSVNYPDNATSAEINVTLGNKNGTYTVSSTFFAATMPSPFTFTAVGQLKAPENPDTEEDNGEKSCKEEVGDPITLGRGNSFQEETDYPQTGLSILEFSRYYNAQGSNSRVLGNYWSSTYDRFVLPPQSAGLPAKVRRPDGLTLSFANVGGLYQPRSYFEASLVKTGSGWTFTDKNKTVETFDSTGRLLTITDRFGRGLTMTYDTAGNLTKVTANTGEYLTLVYNTFKQLASLTNNAGHTWTYTYNGYSALVSVRRPFGANKNYYYEDPNSPFLLTSTWEGVSGSGPDSNGAAQAYWRYDALGRATASYFRGNKKRVDVTYLPDGGRVVTDSLGRVTTYKTRLVNGRGFVTEAVGPGFSTCGLADGVYEYDVDMNVTARTEFGRRTEYGNFDAKGQYGFMIEAAGTPSARRTDYVYDARFVGKETRITSPSVSAGRQKTIDIAYDDAGNVLSRTVSGFRPDGTPVTRATTYEYGGPYGQISRIDGPRTDVADITTFEYHPTTKRLLRVTNPDGLVVRNNLAYTASGQLATEDRPNGLRLTYTYVAGTNLIATLTEVQGAATRKTTWTYNAQHRVASVTYHDDASTDFVVAYLYDDAGDLRSVTNPAAGSTEGGVGISFTRDTEGNPIQDIKGPYAGSFSVSRTFDAYNRIDNLINFTGTTDYDYHPDGTLSQVSDGKRQVTAYQYDDFKRLTRAVRPGQVVTEFGYDPQNHLIKVTDPNLAVTQYNFDDLGNRLEVVSPDAGTTLYAHDASGNVTQVTDAKGQVTFRTYSPANRPMTVDRPLTMEDETHTYDFCLNGSGKLCRIDSGNGEFIAYEYDGFGRVSKIVTRNGTVAYSHDATDNVTSITYPSGRKVVYTRNSASQVTQVSLVDGLRTYSLASNVQYLPMGPARSWTYGNGLAEVRQFNPQYLPTSLGVTGKFVATYPTYDANANVASMVINGQAQDFDYDALDRLTSASGSFGLRSYTYDGAGNRRSSTEDGIVNTLAYETQSSRLATDSTWTYTLDANGNQVQKADNAGLGRIFDYTTQNQLENVSDASNPMDSLGTYLYNALGQRTLKAINGDTRRFIFGADGSLLSESLVDGTIVEEVVYLNGRPLALLGRPPVSTPPPVIDTIVDDVAPGSPWVQKSTQNAFGGKYQLLTVSSPYTDTYSWNWTPTVSGYYDIWTWWVRRPSDGTTTLYTIDGGYALSQVTHANQVQGAWTYLGRYHLLAGRQGLQLEEWRHSPTYGSPSGGSLAADAARFKLVSQDTGQEGKFNYVITDHLGTARAVTDWSGKVIWSATYDPFGAATVNDDPDGDSQAFTMNLRFPGQYFDAETGLNYNMYRDYDPGLGRYLQSDPIGLAGGINTFAYASGNPINRYDILGLADNCPVDEDEQEEREKQCDYLHYEVDVPVCNAISKKRGADAARRCFASAMERYAACRQGKPLPQLDTTVWRDTGPDLPPQPAPEEVKPMNPAWLFILIPLGILAALTGVGS